jgi:chitin disaccharide deacetylase
MKRLIINADDFGMSKEVNDGIKRAIKAGAVNSVSVMVNMPYFDDAIQFLKKHPEVSVGLHLNITEGGPISSPHATSTLLREDNNFFFWVNLMVKYFLKKVSLKEIAAELATQHKKLVSTGLEISHIDSHHHIHLFPPFFKIVLAFVREKKIPTLRCRRFRVRSLTVALFETASIKALLILFLCFINNVLARPSRHHFNDDTIFDMHWDSRMSKKRFLHILSSLPDGTIEIICHPGVMSKWGNAAFLAPRQHELRLLTDPRVIKRIRQIRNGNKK